MPTPPLSDEKKAEALALVEQHGTVNAAADAVGIPRETLRHRFRMARAENQAGPGVMDALERLGVDASSVRGGWLKDKGASIRFDVPKADDDLIDRIAERVERIMPAPAIKRPPQVSTELCNFFPLFDFHLSMKIGGYGTSAAVDRIREGAQDVIGRTPAAESCIILNGGDWTHQNDDSNQTPQSKHPLPVDTDYLTTTDIGTDITVELIFSALARHDHVTYKALKGNHDPHTALILRAALRQRFRDDPRVTIDDDGIDFFIHLWRKNLICGHHGNLKGKKPRDIALALAALNPKAFSDANRREIHTGHRHHLSVEEIPGWTWYQHHKICPMDQYAKDELWVSEAAMTGITYHASGRRYGAIDHYFS